MASGPRSWGKIGSASGTSVALTCGGATPFYPASLYIENTDTTNAFYINWQDAAATTTDNVHNIRINAGKALSFNFNTQNVSNSFIVNIITAAATPGYNIFAIADR